MAGKFWLKLLVGAGAVAGSAWAFDQYSRKNFQRSGLSLAWNKYLEITPKNTVQQEMAKLDELKGTERTEHGIPKVFLTSSLASVYDDGNDEDKGTFGMTTYSFSPTSFDETIAPHTTILYVHGGAYVAGIDMYHCVFATRMANRYGVTVLMPDYNPAPYGNAEEAYRTLTALYTNYRILNPDEKIILMGDSAGAGLIFGLALTWAEQGLKAPEGIIAISPWLDVTLENEKIEAYAELDPMLNADTLRVDGREWAGSWSMSDSRISPIHGDATLLKDSVVTLFVGTDEILYPDVTEFANALKLANVDTTLHIGEKMSHDYPLHPLPEAQNAFEQIEMGIITSIVR